MRKITVSLLREHCACATGIAKFKRLFPDGVIVTRELCVQHAHQFDWDWAAGHLLTPTARAQYDAAIATVLAQYLAAIDVVWAQYDAANAAAFADAYITQENSK
jgi:hypothetical protein